MLELAGGDDDLWDRVRALPEQQRWAVALFYVADRSVADIAAVLGCSEGAGQDAPGPGPGDARPPARAGGTRRCAR